MRSWWLFAGGTLSALAALLHLACIVGGSRWYLAMGAGPGIARMAERGSWTPALITLGIASTLFIWAAYAFSGAGMIPRLPLLRTGLVAITAIYLLRAAALPWMLVQVGSPARGLAFLYVNPSAFLYVSSLIVLVFGLVYAIGLWKAWGLLAPVP